MTRLDYELGLIKDDNNFSNADGEFLKKTCMAGCDANVWKKRSWRTNCKNNCRNKYRTVEALKDDLAETKDKLDKTVDELFETQTTVDETVDQAVTEVSEQKDQELADVKETMSGKKKAAYITAGVLGLGLITTIVILVAKK
jgi:hypothetical protein